MIPPSLQVSIAGSPELQRRQINSIFQQLLMFVGYGSSLPSPSGLLDGALYNKSGDIYKIVSGAWVLQS